MGACFDCVSIAPCSTEELKSKFKDLQEDYCNDHGADTYAGHIGIAPGMTISSKAFKSSDLAQDWLSQNSEKGEPALAVKVGDFTNVFPKTETEKKLAATFAELQGTINNWDTDIIKRVKAGKSLQRTCSKCTSKVTVSYIKTNACPVCSDKAFLQTDTDAKKLAALKIKYNETKKKVDEAKQKYAQKNKGSFWLIGAWCAS